MEGQYLFFLTAVLVLIMSASLSMFKYYQRKRREFRHLGEFFIALLLMVCISYFFGTKDSRSLTLTVLPWLWVLKTFSQMLEDVSGVSLVRKFYFSIMGVGAVLSIGLASLGYELPYILYPFSISITVVGCLMLYDAVIFSRRERYGIIHYVNFFFMLAFFISRLVYFSSIGPVLDFSFAFIFASILFPLYAESIFERQEQFLENALFVRNRQLFSHSSFSEFRILSAGVSHEINNALTIVNAKVEQMIRKSRPEDEKNLRVIQHAADRIGKSMRSLREFIYPHDDLEELKLQDIVNDVLMLYGQRLRNHDVKVTTEGFSGKYAQGHRIQLEQVFLSLLNTAVDNIDKLKDKWIAISCKTDQDMIEIIFSDSSRGISKDIKMMLEDPFYCTEENVDNGIRLVLAKDILKKHGGSFRYEENAYNTTFIIELPAVDVYTDEASESQSMSLH